MSSGIDLLLEAADYVEMMERIRRDCVRMMMSPLRVPQVGAEVEIPSSSTSSHDGDDEASMIPSDSSPPNSPAFSKSSFFCPLTSTSDTEMSTVSVPSTCSTEEYNTNKKDKEDEGLSSSDSSFDIPTPKLDVGGHSAREKQRRDLESKYLQKLEKELGLHSTFTSSGKISRKTALDKALATIKRLENESKGLEAQLFPLQKKNHILQEKWTSMNRRNNNWEQQKSQKSQIHYRV